MAQKWPRQGAAKGKVKVNTGEKEISTETTPMAFVGTIGENKQWSNCFVGERSHLCLENN